MDEHRVGLQPILRPQWTPAGRRPLVTVEPRYEWLYIYGFVRPTTGENFWLLLPTVSINAFNIALQHFRQALSPTRRINLVLDQAAWHTSPQVIFPHRIQPTFLPPYSPEIQPAEHLWHLVDQPLYNRHFDSLDVMITVLSERCRWLHNQLELVQSATFFNWWPQYA